MDHIIEIIRHWYGAIFAIPVVGFAWHHRLYLKDQYMFFSGARKRIEELEKKTDEDIVLKKRALDQRDLEIAQASERVQLEFDKLHSIKRCQTCRAPMKFIKTVPNGTQYLCFNCNQYTTVPY